MTNTQPSGYLRVATACPPVTVADVPANTAAVRECYLAAVAEHCAVVVTPELSLTGYSLGDLVLRRGLRAAALDALAALAADTATHATILVVGLPLAQLDAIYNVAAVLAGGRVIGLVPKTHLPTYGEFYEKRWYQSWQGADTTINIAGESVPFGTGLVFVVGDCRFGVEICEDLWVNHAPSQRLVDNGVQVVLNPSASPSWWGRRRIGVIWCACTAHASSLAMCMRAAIGPSRPWMS